MTQGTVGTDETLDTTSSEPETDEVLDEGVAGEDLGDIPCSETGMVEEELICLDDTLTALEVRLTEAENKAAEYLDGWQRTQASFANYRKRTEAEQAHWRSAANANLLTRLLPILDDFSPERAETYLRDLASPAPLIRTSAKSGHGLDNWLQWLRGAVIDVRRESENAPPAHKHHHHEHGADPRNVTGQS